MLYCRIPAKEEIGELWPTVRPLLVEALNYHTPGCAPFQVKANLENGEWRLLVVEDAGRVIAAGCLHIVELPLTRQCRFELFGGERMAEWLPLLTDVEEWAISQGCTSFRLFGRRGWARILDDWRETAVVLEKDIG